MSIVEQLRSTINTYKKAQNYRSVPYHRMEAKVTGEQLESIDKLWLSMSPEGYMVMGGVTVTLIPDDLADDSGVYLEGGRIGGPFSVNKPLNEVQTTALTQTQQVQIASVHDMAAMKYKPTAQDIHELADWLYTMFGEATSELVAQMPEWYKPMAAWNQLQIMNADDNVKPWEIPASRVEYLSSMWVVNVLVNQKNKKAANDHKHAIDRALEHASHPIVKGDTPKRSGVGRS